jgi:hypothetical protein
MNAPKPYDLTTHGGKRVDWLTKAALLKAERMLGYELTIVQGSYNSGKVSASAGTHDGGGVVDLAPWDWERKVRALRLCGFRAWYRKELWKNGKRVWGDHIHAVQQGNDKLSPGAVQQVLQAIRGRDGLAASGPDPHPHLKFKKFSWPYGGVVGLARWRRDQLTGLAREKYLKRLRKVVRGN